LRLPYAEVTASGFLFADRQLNSDVTHPSAAAEVHMPVVASGPLQMNPQAELQNSGHSGNLQALRLGIDSIVGYRPNYSQQSSVCCESVQFGERPLAQERPEHCISQSESR